jgi:hypothetical protein
LCEVVEAELALQRPVDLCPAIAHVPKYRAESLRSAADEQF